VRGGVTERIFTYAAFYAMRDYLALGWIARPALDGTHHGTRYCLVEWLCTCRPIVPLKR
jgi:hypothetical protein